ncbi:GGDEF domain-containing protein [Halomonas sp. M1]|uniref:GGDEF domain-containing protein n=1 Tax=Halomonas sp. M1 TaxID=3035470 RepID=UPI002485AB47|nr:GGDEF domain-containing protein [Halomonas sp. M1]WFE70324.1 GGDEF domain-containing protein [Halomonas sp. M1]
MKWIIRKSMAWQLTIALILLTSTYTVTILLYDLHTRYQAGSHYTSLVAVIARSQAHTSILRNTLEDFRNRPEDTNVVNRLENLLWRIPQHINGVSFHLQTSQISENDYYAPLKQLKDIREGLSEMHQQLDEIKLGGSPYNFLNQGQIIENDLAMAYTILEGIAHSEAGKQQIFMERLGRTVAALSVTVIILITVLLIGFFKLRQKHHKVLHLSMFDALTQLGNRRYLLHHAEAFCRNSQRCDSPLSLIIIDIDHFKYVNDAFGHPAGDQVLERISEVLKREARAIDVVARLGGEEFCILMPDTSLDGAMQLAERLRQKICGLTHQQLNVATSITVSLGVTVACKNDMEFKKIYSRADKALYKAKTNGRNRVESA